MNIAKQILQFNAGRDPQRLALKYRAMRRDPLVFMRGTCHLFYLRMPMEAVIRKAPPAWACGDLHLENFGTFKGEQRQVCFDINDFDEALLAPCTWDLVRGLASILVGRHSMQLDERLADAPLKLCKVFLEAYCQALEDGRVRRIEAGTAPEIIAELMHHAQARHRKDFLDTRTTILGGQRQLRIDGIKALAPEASQREQVTQLMQTLARSHESSGFFDVLDVARRISGTGSLGLPRYIILVRGKGSPDQNYLLDLKLASSPSGLPLVLLPQPEWSSQAHRIVALQQRMQDTSMAFLHAVEWESRPWVLRALQPGEDRVELAQTRHRMSRLRDLMQALGACLAWAQLRSAGMQGSSGAQELSDFGSRRSWQPKMLQLAQHCADQVERDWALYARAFDEGYFSAGTA